VRMIRLVAGAFLVLACASGAKAGAAPDADWLLYQKLYIGPEGRVIDTGNGGISHSEGQGIGLLLAAHHRDRAAFDKIWRWTQLNLQFRADRLLAWKWAPGENGGGIADANNATDGDLFVAWALSRGARLWGEAQYLQAAREISRDIRVKMIVQSDHGLLLLPAEHGFVKPEGVTINLSYWLFPALQDMHRLDPAPEWADLIESGLNLLRSGRFGRWQLPPDWLRIADKLEIAPEFKPRFSYDAVRIPLYLIWAKLDNADNLKAFNDFWGHFTGARFVPAWSALSDDSIDSYNASAGIRAIISLARLQATVGGKARIPRLPRLEPGKDYYSANLLLLTKMAALESRAR